MQKSKNILHTTSALLSFFLFAGVAVQAIGYYSLLVIFPCIYFWRIRLASVFYERMRSLGLGLFTLWAIFPISSLYNYFYDTSVPIAWSLLLKSHLSSCVGITGLVLYLYSFKDRWWSVGVKAPPQNLNLFKPFLQGLVIACVFECIYVFCEQTLGTNFLGNVFGENRRMVGGLFRAPGFYSHPLSLAAVGLAYFAFTTTLAVQKLSVLRWWQHALLILVSTYLVFASGGRAALVLVMFFALLAFFSVCFRILRKGALLSTKQRFIFYCVPPLVLIVSWCFFRASGLEGRFANLATSYRDSPEFERLIFWRVHWQIFWDHPWMGQGIALLDAFQRERYYAVLGFASLARKYPAHNIILETLSNVGLLGSVVILRAVAWIWKALRTLRPSLWIYLRAVLAAVFLNVLNGLTQNVFFDASVVYIYLSFFLLLLWSDTDEPER